MSRFRTTLSVLGLVVATLLGPVACTSQTPDPRQLTAKEFSYLDDPTSSALKKQGFIGAIVLPATSEKQLVVYTKCPRDPKVDQDPALTKCYQTSGNADKPLIIREVSGFENGHAAFTKAEISIQFTKTDCLASDANVRSSLGAILAGMVKLKPLPANNDFQPVADGKARCLVRA